MTCQKCGADVSVNEYEICAYCERMVNAISQLLMKRSGGP